MPQNLTKTQDSDVESPLILVVEDNTVNVRLTCEMLRTGGYRTCIATDGQSGLRCARELQPALIVADLQMPVLDGLSMARQLKASADTAAIPILALTAHVRDEHRAAAAECGCVGFLTKPIRLRTLLHEVAHVLQHSAVSRV